MKRRIIYLLICLFLGFNAILNVKAEEYNVIETLTCKYSYNVTSSGGYSLYYNIDIKSVNGNITLDAKQSAYTPAIEIYANIEELKSTINIKNDTCPEIYVKKEVDTSDYPSAMIYILNFSPTVKQNYEKIELVDQKLDEDWQVIPDTENNDKTDENTTGFLFSEFDLCFQPGFLRAIYLVKTLLNIIRIAVPIGVIVKSILDIYKGILDPKDKDGLNSLKNRFIAMVVIFLIPTIINAFMGLINYVMGKNVYNGVSECWTQATPEHIAALQVNYNETLAQLLLDEKELQKSYQDQAKILLEKIIANQKLANKVGEYANNTNTIKCGEGPNYNSQLQSYVQSAGYRTRQGVVAAANYLSSHVNIHIPYFWTGGHIHRYSGPNDLKFYDFISLRENGKSFEATLGLSPYWGCLVEMQLEKGTKEQPIGSITPFGMDCSGFVVWAIRNGGYDTNCSFSAGEDEGLQRKFCGVSIESVSVANSKGQIKAGDVVYRPGHVGMIVEVSDNGFKVAEERGFNYGLVVTDHTYSSSTFDYVLLLDNFYNK